jgi:tetrahydromethanopterin S-methyltransferase subunit E
MSVSTLELWALTYIHISAVIVWIAAHLFETFVLHYSLHRVAEKSKLEIYPALFARFRTVTGLGSATTLFSGVLLSTAINLGSLSYVIATPWGLLSCVYFGSAILNHSLGLKPSSLAYSTLRMLGTVALVGAATTVSGSFDKANQSNTFRRN